MYRREGDQLCVSVCVCVMSRGAYTPAWVVSVYPIEKSQTRRIIALLVHWAVCFMPSCIVEFLFSNFHTLWTWSLFYLKGLYSESCCDPHPRAYVLNRSNAVHTHTLMSWVNPMQSTLIHLYPESVWCSPHPHTYVLSQSDAVHTLIPMSWVIPIQSTLTCPESVWCSPNPHTLFPDSVFVLWSTRLPFCPLLEGFELAIGGLLSSSYACYMFSSSLPHHTNILH
jgi:hypothetical protein